MDLKEQKYVCTLAECKSLTRASERLYISQPALSLYINNVEKILGARLFERNGRKFELTWLGKQYVEKASQMLELERQFEAVRRQAERENAGQVRIGIAQRHLVSAGGAVGVRAGVAAGGCGHPGRKSGRFDHHAEKPGA